MRDTFEGWGGKCDGWQIGVEGMDPGVMGEGVVGLIRLGVSEGD